MMVSYLIGCIGAGLIAGGHGLIRDVGIAMFCWSALSGLYLFVIPH
jgi:small ligand-binding sensory domain FIST